MVMCSLNLPAMLALIKHTKLPVINALIAADAITLRLSGDIELSPPIIIPNELGLAKPHTANVVMAALLI